MSHLSPEELRQLRRLHIQAGRRVDSVFAGDWRTAVRGRGMEFEEVREYHPGDDIRHIDWNVTARTNEPHVKVYREERELTVLIAVDVSGSTRIGSGGRDGRTDRRLQIARIAGGLAYAGVRNRDRVGLITFSDRVEDWVSPRKTRGHVWNIIQHVFEVYGTHRDTDLAEALSFIAKVQRRRAVLVVISDFLDDGPWQRAMGLLTRRHEVHTFVVDDPLDQKLPGPGLLELVDAETGRPFLVDSRAIQPRVPVAQRVRQLRQKGATAAAISTGQDPFAALHRHFQKLGMRR